MFPVSHRSVFLCFRHMEKDNLQKPISEPQRNSTPLSCLKALLLIEQPRGYSSSGMQQCCSPGRFPPFPRGESDGDFLRVAVAGESQGETHVKGSGSAAVTGILGNVRGVDERPGFRIRARERTWKGSTVGKSSLVSERSSLTPSSPLKTGLLSISSLLSSRKEVHVPPSRT